MFYLGSRTCELINTKINVTFTFLEFASASYGTRQFTFVVFALISTAESALASFGLKDYIRLILAN